MTAAAPVSAGAQQPAVGLKRQASGNLERVKGMREIFLEMGPAVIVDRNDSRTGKL
jgi:hypothetical protein